MKVFMCCFEQSLLLSKAVVVQAPPCKGWTAGDLDKGPMGDLRKDAPPWEQVVVFESKQPFVRVTLQLDEAENIRVSFFDYVKNQEVMMYDSTLKPHWATLERCFADSAEFQRLVNSDPALRLKFLGWLVVEGMDIVHALAGREIDKTTRKILQPSKL